VSGLAGRTHEDLALRAMEAAMASKTPKALVIRIQLFVFKLFRMIVTFDKS
jgi:hypothetical protein